MVLVRYIERSAVVSFCPSAPYLLAGSAASAIDLNFSTASVLEVFKVNFDSPPPELPPASNPLVVGERFHSCTWGKTGIDTRQHPLGLVAGGLEDTSVNLWDPNRILQSTDVSRCTVSKLKKHTSVVRALDFNPNLTQFLATGSTEPELFIWDLTKPSVPVQMTSAQLSIASSGMESDFTCSRWNEKVHQILASCTTSGKTIVQDMRRAKPVASLHDMSSSRRCSVLEWSPERPTQVLVASEDDRTPTVQVWDLRNSASPLTELVGHSKGILSMSWSPHDSRLLLTCAKDGKTYCWDVQTSSIIAEQPPLGAWHLHVQWSPITPSLFSVSSFDGKIGICSFDSMTGPLTAGQPSSINIVPKWMNRPGGLSFGFGGKLVSVVPSRKHSLDGASKSTGNIKTTQISIKDVETTAESIPNSEEFDAAIRSGDRDTVSEYCRSKEIKTSGNDRETWEMLRLMFSTDAKRQLLTHLGFKDIELIQNVGVTNKNGEASTPPPVFSEVHTDSGVHDALDFFENLPDEGTEYKESPKPIETKPNITEVTADINEDEIQKALLVRNYEAAVELCFKTNRAADALIIAHAASPELFDRVRHRYMEQNPKPFMSLVASIAANDFQKLIQSRNVSEWKETLAMLIVYVDDAEAWTSLCDALGTRLYQSGNIHAASICFVCSGNVEKAVSVWSSQGTESLERMHEIIEKAFVLSCAVPQEAMSPTLCTIVHNYSQVLASQGLAQEALTYLSLLPGSPSENIQILKDRISNSWMVPNQEQSWGTQMKNEAAPSHTTDYVGMPPPPYPPTNTSQAYLDPYGGGYTASGNYGSSYSTQLPTAPVNTSPSHQQAFQPVAPTQVHAPSVFTPQIPQQTMQSSTIQPPPAFHPVQTPTPALQHRPPVADLTPQPSFVPTPGTTPVPSLQPNVFYPGAQPSPMTAPPPVQTQAQPTEPIPPSDINALNADTSNMPTQFKPIVNHMKSLFTKFESANVAPSQRRIVADASKRIGLLFWDMNQGKIPPAVAEKVMKYSQSLVAGDMATASKVLEDLTETAWNESSSHWLSSFKRLIRLAQTIK